jgi:hypothetical protein
MLGLRWRLALLRRATFHWGWRCHAGDRAGVVLLGEDWFLRISSSSSGYLAPFVDAKFGRFGAFCPGTGPSTLVYDFSSGLWYGFASRLKVKLKVRGANISKVRYISGASARTTSG